jgi:DNA-binding transcriptional LysR family regulator
MQLVSLKIFCDVVRWASFSRGARENGISQSSASQVVHQLEVRLGVKLIDRSKRPLVPTPQGKVYYDGCKELVVRYLEIENRVKALEDDRNLAGTVRVAAIYSVGLHHMSRYVERFRGAYPEADVRLEYQHPTRVIESVIGGDAELGLVSFPRKWPELTAIPWREEEMVVAVHPTHRYAGLDAVDVEQLDGETFVGFEADLPIRRAVDRFLRKHGVHVRVALEFDNIETIKRAVEVPSGVAILPAPTVAGEVAAGTLRAIRFRDRRPTRPLAIIHRRSEQLGLAASRFLDLLTAAEEPSADGPAFAADGPARGSGEGL